MKNEYSIILTEDGTETIYSNNYSESMHTIDGAYEEAIHKHVEPSGIVSRNVDEIHILDVGFGVGYNILALLSEIEKKDNNKRIHIVSFEKDRSYQSLIDSISFQDQKNEIYAIIKQAFHEGKAEFKTGDITVRFGDARSSIQEQKDSVFHCVFQDPYSPAKNPELWTVEFFNEIHRVLKDDGIITTYSSAPQVRRAMLEAGLFVGRGPAFGRKKESTLASKDKERLTSVLHETEMVELHSNIKSMPYHDPGMNNSREYILQKRIDEMKQERERKQHDEA